MYFRGTSALQNGTGYSAWRTVIHSGNIGSQTVSTATTATGNAGSVTYLSGRTDVAAYPILWGAGYTNTIGTIAYSCAAVTIQSSTGTVNATTFSGAGTGLTGTASSLSIGGNSATTSQTSFSTLTVNSNTTTGTAAGIINLGTTGDPSDNANSSVIGLTWGQRGDSNPYYIVRSNKMTYGSYTYNRLDLSWHTGLQMGAATTYGGTRIYNNSTFLGTQIVSIGDGDNKLRCTDDIIAYSSDKRLKENITNIPNALNKIKQINGVYFDWKDKTEELGFYPSQKHDVGVIAQEIQAILPEVVTLAPFDYELGKSKSGENYLTVKYEKIVPLLIEAIKEQQSQIEELKTIINGITR